MKKSIAKKATAVAVMSFLLVGSIFAGQKSDSKKRMRGDNVPRNEKVMRDKEVPPAETPMDSSMTSTTMENGITGEWGLRDNDKEIKVTFGNDGTMGIQWKQGTASSTDWKGVCATTDSEITFTVNSKETKTNNTKQMMREDMNATWKIQYAKTNDTLTLTSSDLPQELANLTLSRIGRL